ncbi:uncharacterized protein METZ01_LOCUS301036 [marine metagenome]|uniref:Uncharacterized protein n=1 Tax=marine metagenome TaxID=408172 RepID=A0A382MLA2_9ZZZZ
MVLNYPYPEWYPKYPGFYFDSE